VQTFFEDAVMPTTWTLLDLAGSVALLLWGVHMVQSGILRAFGPQLRRYLGGALGSRGKAFLAGLGVTALLQSSTATGLMATSFAASGLVALMPALAVMLGANVGTTLIVQVLSFDVSRVAPVLILAGLILFRRETAFRSRDLGRVAIGLGLMLMALHEILVLVTPYEDVPSLRLLMGAIATEPMIDVVLAAVLTWAAHSSVAVVLLVMSFAAKGVIPLHAAFALVLGANLGTAINPVVEGVSGGDPAARRLPIGNLVNRVLACALGLAVLNLVGPHLASIETDSARAVADFHTLFNLVVAAISLPLLGPMAKLLVWLLPARVDASDPSRPMYLDPAAREMPSIALAGAAREALRMADILETMLEGALEALDRGDRRRIAPTKRMDDVLDALNSAIKEYVTRLDLDSLDERDHRRLAQILTFAINLEHAGDVVEKNLMAHASKRLKRGLSFSAEGREELRSILDRLVSNLRAAAAVFMTEDARSARQLAGEKQAFRDLEAKGTAAHLARFRERRPETTETSALHLDVLRDLKRVNDHLVAAAAYPVLDGQGELLPSRVRDVEQL
jgi:phosphate:Na+ symporter